MSPRPGRPVRIVVPLAATGGPAVEVYAPFEARALIKSAIPGSARRWDKSRRCWLVHLFDVMTIRDALRAAGYSPVTTYADGSPWPSHDVPRPDPLDWLTAAFAVAAAGGPARIECLRRALLRVWHPDHGCPPEIAQRINAAAEEARRRRR